jgi:hypothetical protein
MVCIWLPTCSVLAFILLKCKHILAALIARKMKMCIEQPTSADDLAAIFLRRFPSPEKESSNNTIATA